MTVATVTQPNGNGYAVLLVMFLLVGFVTVIRMWVHKRRWDAREAELAEHAQQLAGLDYRVESLLDFLGVEIPEPIEDDSPAAMAADGDTEEIPVCPATVPDGMPLAVQSALIEARDLSDEFPHPVDSAERRAKQAADVEEALKRFDFSGRGR